MSIRLLPWMVAVSAAIAVTLTLAAGLLSASFLIAGGVAAGVSCGFLAGLLIGAEAQQPAPVLSACSTREGER